MTFGLTDAGFVKKTLQDILDELEADEIAEISPSLDVSSSSPIGQINAVFAKQHSEVWDLAQSTYDASDPDKATFDGQDAICAITGTEREAATKSYVRQGMALGVAVTVPAGSIVGDAGNPTVQFVLVGPEPAAGMPVVPGDVVSTTAGTYYGRFECSVTGAITANASQLTEIITPVTGWTATANPADAVVGHPIELDSDLRLRRLAELDSGASTPVDALEAELLQIEVGGVVGLMRQATVFENVDDTTNGDGLPGHSIECLCYDGPGLDVPNDTIAQTIWDGKAGGIKTFGSTNGNAIDSKGDTRVISFSRPTLKTVFFDITVNIDTTIFPADGDDQIKAAIVAKGLLSEVGQDVILASFYPSIFSVTGVNDVLIFLADFTASPGGSVNLPIALRELATYDTGRININHG